MARRPSCTSRKYEEAILEAEAESVSHRWCGVSEVLQLDPAAIARAHSEDVWRYLFDPELDPLVAFCRGVCFAVSFATSFVAVLSGAKPRFTWSSTVAAYGFAFVADRAVSAVRSDVWGAGFGATALLTDKAGAPLPVTISIGLIGAFHGRIRSRTTHAVETLRPRVAGEWSITIGAELGAGFAALFRLLASF
ncbi:MAG TPA: hypothetical protein VFF67_10230 [Thermoplasmata archaeon]|nr:hypothetical protein [Thermoplasmata archaeon]